MEFWSSWIDRLPDIGPSRPLLPITISPYSSAQPYTYRAESVFIKISAAIEQEISAHFMPEMGRIRLQVICTRLNDQIRNGMDIEALKLEATYEVNWIRYGNLPFTILYSKVNPNFPIPIYNINIFITLYILYICIITIYRRCDTFN